MRTTEVAAAVLALSVAWVPARAEKPDASGGGISVVAEEQECEGGPAAVVVHYLGLAPQQASALGQLLQEREQTLAPVVQQIALREQRIRELIVAGGDPAEIGTLAVQVHHLRQQVEAIQGTFLAGFESLLGLEQRARWQQVRLAARLQPVVPAFQALSLL